MKFKEILEISNGIFENTIGILNRLPGLLKDIMTLVILCLIVIGIITLLRKSFKFFGLIIMILIAVFVFGLLAN